MFGQSGFSRGLERFEREEIAVFGFVKQEGNVVSIETKDKIYNVKRDKFIELNHLDHKHKVRQARYRLPQGQGVQITQNLKGNQR